MRPELQKIRELAASARLKQVKDDIGKFQKKDKQQKGKPWKKGKSGWNNNWKGHGQQQGQQQQAQGGYQDKDTQQRR